MSCQNRILSACLPPARHPEAYWDRFLRTASNERILPALHDLSTGFDLPSYIRDVLSAIKQLNRTRNREILDQLKSLCGLLNRYGIEPVALKGIANQLAGVYPDLGTRFLADIDLLIPERDFSAAVHALADLGYRCTESDPVELKIGHSYPPLVGPGCVEVDLHRTLGLGVCRSFLSASEVLSDSVLLEWEGVRLRLPSPEHLVTHHIMHSQMHDSYRDRIWPSLRGLYDLALLTEKFGRDIDWSKLESRFTMRDEGPVLAMYLLQARDLLSLELPVSPRLDPISRLRWSRRKLLRKNPWLRFVDPLYWFLAGFLPRTRRVHEILTLPGGWKYLARKFINPHFYARLRADLS